jgi:hypothetical protein
MDIYGTPIEVADVAMLEALGFEVINPNCAASEAGYKAMGMDYFKKFSVECDLVAFRPVASSCIPAGVAKEVSWFQEANKPVIEIPVRIGERTMSVEDTRAHLRRARELKS